MIRTKSGRLITSFPQGHGKGPLIMKISDDDGATWTLAGFEAVFSSARTWRALGFTLASATATTLLCLVLGLPGAHALYRCSFTGRGFLRAAVAVPFVLPTVAVGVAFGALLRPDGPLGFLGLDGSAVSIVAAMVFFN